MLAADFIDKFFIRMIELRCLADKIKRCCKCPGLNIQGTTESAPGYGTPMSPLMLVGQSLCRDCMVTQIPFTKASGYLIDRGLAMAGIFRWDVFITNVVHCHPPNNRASTNVEVDNCIGYLMGEIQIVKPMAIVTFGKDAANAIGVLAHTDAIQIGKDTNTPIKIGNVNCEAFALYHPAYVMRGGFSERTWLSEFVALVEEFSYGDGIEFPIS